MIRGINLPTCRHLCQSGGHVLEECRKPDSDQANFLVSGCLNKLSEANWLFNLTAVLTDSHNVNCSSEGIQLWPHPSLPLLICPKFSKHNSDLCC